LSAVKIIRLVHFSGFITQEEMEEIDENELE
jgi:hypothetical protein